MTPNGEQELPYYPLHDYRVHWQLLGTESREFASGTENVNPGAPVSVEQAVPARNKKEPFRLVIKLFRPDGSLAMERALASQ